MSENKQMEDFLDADNPIPGQNYVCLSFVSPDKCLKRKDLFFMTHFLQNYLEENSSKDLDYNSVEKLYDDFLFSNEQSLTDKFNDIVDFQCHTRGLKIRGVYETRKEAENRAKILQKRDPNFHVFVGQVGFWLPWDPTNMENINPVYQEEQLNKLVYEYNKNKEDKDQVFAENKELRVEAAKKEIEMRKRAAELKKQQRTMVSEEESVQKIQELREMADEKDDMMVSSSDNNESAGVINELTDEQKKIFGSEDIWMKRKDEEKKLNEVNEEIFS